jgi:2-dehydropantoate 2-reductase
MKVLVVGAGAVGQVFGYHLAQGGADVTFLVKPKYVDEHKNGFTLYKLPKTAPTAFKANVVSEVTGTWDQVYLTVSSTAFRAGTWYAELARATGDATIVVLQPGIDDHAFAASHAAEARLVDGTINFLSYHAPLPGETRFAAPGMAYWHFPGKGPFSGERAADVVAALRAGKLPAKRVASVPNQTAFPSAMLSAFVAALEASNWSFAAMRKDGMASLGGRAAREAMRVVERERGRSAPLGPRLASRAFGMISRIAARVAPVDLETYMRVHFTKVGDQMHEGIAKYVERGRAASLDVGALEDLAKRLAAPST